MRILLVDADSRNKFPNLALMKISAWYKKITDTEIDLIKGIPESPPLIKYDRVYISCIFFQNADRVRDYASVIDGDEIQIGGSGIDLSLELEKEIEHIQPDYSLYKTDFSMGFTSRGCVRKCSWCIVPEKEGSIRDSASIAEFHSHDHTKIILLDNNFLASPKWKMNLQYIIDNKLRVNFNSGLDIRLITEENTLLLKQTKIRDWQFKKTKYTFAYDLPSHKKSVLKGIKTLRNAGINIHRDNCIFYVLVGYNTTPQQDLERIHFLIEQGVGPYVMRYNKTTGPNRILLHLSRWVNRKLYQFMDFADYDHSDSKESYKVHFMSDCPQRIWSKKGEEKR